MERGKPHERATQTLGRGTIQREVNQKDGSVKSIDSYMTTPVVRDWHRLSTQEQNLAYSHFMSRIIYIVLRYNIGMFFIYIPC